jgi:hypothetical protein
MCNDFLSQRRCTLDGHWHKIDNARGKASLSSTLDMRTGLFQLELLNSRTSCRASTTREEVYGQYSEGRTNTVLPQMRGMATAITISGMGAFHGTTEYLPSQISRPQRRRQIMKRTQPHARASARILVLPGERSEVSLPSTRPRCRRQTQGLQRQR